MSLHQTTPLSPQFSRRELLTRSGMGMGMLALAELTARENAQAAGRETPVIRHHPAQAKQVVHLFMNGGPSHVDSTPSHYSINSTASRCPIRTCQLNGKQQAHWVPHLNSESTASPVSQSVNCLRKQLLTWTTCASSDPCILIFPTMSLRSYS